MLSLLCGAAVWAAPVLDAPIRTGAQATDDAAVVIGIEDYAFVQDVPHAEADAEATWKTLVYTRGVPAAKVQQLSSASREQILAAVDRAARDVGPEGTLWVTFSGHGAASPEDGSRLLLGDDVKADPTAFASRGVSIEELEARVASSDARHVVFLLDTCYAGLGRSGEALLPGARLAVPTWAPSPAPRVTVWSAAEGNQLAGPLPGKDHGAFSYFALQALQGEADGELSGDRDGMVTLEEADVYVRRSLREAGIRNQTPSLAGETALVLTVGVQPAPTEATFTENAVPPTDIVRPNLLGTLKLPALAANQPATIRTAHKLTFASWTFTGLAAALAIPTLKYSLEGQTTGRYVGMVTLGASLTATALASSAMNRAHGGRYGSPAKRLGWTLAGSALGCTGIALATSFFESNLMNIATISAVGLGLGGNVLMGMHTGTVLRNRGLPSVSARVLPAAGPSEKVSPALALTWRI